MAGNIFSGHYGRRSSAPYLDELPRVVASQTSRSSFRHESSSLFVSFNESLHPIALMRVRIGATSQYRLICEQCGRRCRILYLRTLLGCRHCTERAIVPKVNPQETDVSVRPIKSWQLQSLIQLIFKIKCRGDTGRPTCGCCKQLNARLRQ